MKLKSRISKKQAFLLSFFAVVALLFVVKILRPSIFAGQSDGKKAFVVDSVVVSLAKTLCIPLDKYFAAVASPAHSIRGVSSYETAFPDINDEQLVSARNNGIKPQQTRKGIKALVQEYLDSIADCSYYTVDKLKNSVPYLVPKGRLLLSAIGSNFQDSLVMKHLPLARIVVTSVLRSIDDVTTLQGKNVNSAPNSCHFYGTTFDISYTRYSPVYGADGRPGRVVRDDTLKWVLSEVLRDLRQAGTCHIKHEKKQGCFHITVK